MPNLTVKDLEKLQVDYPDAPRSLNKNKKHYK